MIIAGMLDKFIFELLQLPPSTFNGNLILTVGTFSTENFVNSQPTSSLLVYFSGILGFPLDARSYLPAEK